MRTPNISYSPPFSNFCPPQSRPPFPPDTHTLRPYNGEGGSNYVDATWKCQISYKNEQIRRTVAPSYAACLEDLANWRNVASLIIFVGITLTGSTGSSSYLREVYSLLIDCMIFRSPFLDFIRMSTSTVSFLAQLKSWS